MKEGYESPRWSGEIADCSMPMTFDTYSVCSYNCLYCFSYFQKSHCVKGYLEKEPMCVKVDSVKQMFLRGLGLDTSDKKMSRGYLQFLPYIKRRYVMQWGGLADGFDEFERHNGVSLKLLEFFDEIDYPLSISTKGAWWTEDRRYMDIVERHQHNWHFKISIITADPLKARLIERGVPSPDERLAAMKRLTDSGIHVTLRLRPYLIGVSDDYRKLILKAKEAGADSVTTEFFCLEARATADLLAKYEEMSRIAGIDLYSVYRKESTCSGYRRLNYESKRGIITDMEQFVHRLGLRFYVSDAHHKERSDYCCCCGVPPEWNVFKGHFAEALQIAKTSPDNTVRWSDFGDALFEIVGGIGFGEATGFNESSNFNRMKRLNQTLYDTVHEWWNSPKDGKSPLKYFDGILIPIGLDENHDVVYRLNLAKIAGNDK